MSRFSGSTILAGMLLSLMPLFSAVARAELVHCYSFDSVEAQANQTALDAFGVRDGTVMGGATYVEGASFAADDWAINLNENGAGSNTDFVQFEETDFGGQFTIAAWIKPADIPQSNEMMGIASNTHGGFAGPDGFKWTVNQWDVRDQSLRLETGDTNTGTNGGTTDLITYDEWQHVAIAFDKDAGQVEMFLNGESVYTAGNILDFSDGLPWRVGGFHPDYITGAAAFDAPGNAGFIGAIDDVVVFDERLDATALIQFLTDGPACPPTTELTCDLNGDGDCDTDDIDTLMNEVAVGTNNPDLDLNADGVVDDLDRNEWLVHAGPQNGFSGPLLVGDADLDGTVNAADLNALAVSWSSNKDNWTEGNFTGGDVNASDLNQLALNWQASTPLAAAVPEATGMVLFGIAVGCIFSWLRIRRSWRP